MKIKYYENDLPENLDFGEIVAIDTETMGLNPARDRLCLVQLSSGNGICHLVKILDLRKKVNDLLSSFKFSKNSSVNIKNYTIDRNLKTMKKDNASINLTEKEVNLLVLLNEEKKPLNKKIILKKIWQYSSDADTHTVETHIYRLRKKVLEKFGDGEFINIFKEGYSL